MTVRAGLTRRETSAAAAWRPSRAALLALAVSLVLLSAIAAFIVGSSSVVAEGQLLPYTESRVYDIETFGQRIYIEADVLPSADVVVSATLLFVAGMALLTWLVLSVTGSGARSEQRFYGLSAIGLSYLAVDELFGIHETIGHNLLVLDPLVMVRPDEIVLVAYGLLALSFVMWSGPTLASPGVGARLWGIALLVYTTALVFEVLGIGGQDVLKIVIAGFVGAGMTSTAFNSLRWAVVPRHRGRVSEALGEPL